MSFIDRSGLGTGAIGGGSEAQCERSRRLQYIDEVRAVEAFILVEEIMRRRYNVSVRGPNFSFLSATHIMDDILSDSIDNKTIITDRFLIYEYMWFTIIPLIY